MPALAGDALYALRRDVAGIGSTWPCYRIDEAGHVHRLGQLHALRGDRYYVQADARIAASAIDGLSDGLPYFLQDQRPDGFLGRGTPARYPELNLPQRVLDWTDDHYLQYVTRHGSDAVGDLILGEEALTEHLAQLPHRIPLEDRERAYPWLLKVAMEGGLPGSSAHGDHPKFPAFICDERGMRHVLVKFSPARSSDVGQRWSDLLVAEHIAHRTLLDAGIASCHSTIYQFEQRTFLEMNRFDRVGTSGRLGVTSLYAIDLHHYGRLDNWIAAAERLRTDGYIDARTAEQVRLLSTFGALIANTDRHFGNLAFYDQCNGRFALAPAYDTLPMLFAPDHDEIVSRSFVPVVPAAETQDVYAKARQLADRYWKALVDESRISDEFRHISASCLAALEALPRSAAHG